MPKTPKHHRLTSTFASFIEHSLSPFHAVETLSQHLKDQGFIQLDPTEKWSLQARGKYFVTSKETLLAAFILPDKSWKETTLLASHLDSPALKLKPRPEIHTHNILQLGTEVYGGPLLHTWLDRPLSLVGRAMVMQKRQCRPLLIHLKEPSLMIPSLAIHLDRSIHDKGILVHKQDHLKAIVALEGDKQKKLTQLLQSHYDFDKLLSFDLFLVPQEPSQFWGDEKAFFSSYRIDNLSSVFASVTGLTQVESQPHRLLASFFWDHEEIGSRTSFGAGSLWGEELLQRIASILELSPEDRFRTKASSLCLSVDVGHGLHPNFVDKHDPQNTSFLGKGPALKFSAAKHYATSAGAAAEVIRAAEAKNIPYQLDAGRSDIPSGSTVGPIMAANLGIDTLDLGVPCWAMHSTRETMASVDLLSLTQLLKATLERPF
jgi:aspartyl aminopeptidase